MEPLGKSYLIPEEGRLAYSLERSNMFEVDMPEFPGAKLALHRIVDVTSKTGNSVVLEFLKFQRDSMEADFRAAVGCGATAFLSIYDPCDKDCAVTRTETLTGIIDEVSRVMTYSDSGVQMFSVTLKSVSRNSHDVVGS